MSFLMTHLAVAKGVNDKLHIAKDLPSFFLGATAPDAVGMRENFNGNMKVISHYSVAGDTWGQVASVDAWWQQSLVHIKMLKNSPDKDFYFGYFIHVLTDASNHEKMWLPFLEKRLAEDVPLANIKKLVGEDYDRIDWIQYDNYEWSNDVLDLMEAANGLDVEDRVKAREIDEYRDFLLKMYRQNIDFTDLINGVEPPSKADRKLPVYVSVEEILKFVDDTVEEICRDFRV